MAERKFDYNNVSNVYNQMKSINGDIKGLLESIDTEVDKKVNVEDEAIFGDLGAQLLLSWENISSDFPEFMDNFDNWAALVTKASGDYSQFEKDVAAFKNTNPLGVTSAGITQGQVSTSSYNNSYTAEEIEQLDAYARFYEQTGAEYIDTGMVEYAKKHKTMNIVTDVLNVVSIGLSVFQVGSAVKAAKAVATPAINAAASMSDETALAVVNSSDEIVTTGVKAAGQTATSVSDETALAVVNSSDDIGGSVVKQAGQAATSNVGDDGLKVVGEKIGKDGRKFIKVKNVDGSSDLIEAATGKSAVRGITYSADELNSIGINVGDDVTAKVGTQTTKAAQQAAGNTNGASTGAKTGWGQRAKAKWNDSAAGKWTNAQKDKFYGTKFGQKVKASGDAATNRFNNIKDKVSGWGSTAKTGAQNFGNTVKTGATNLGTNIKTGIHNGIDTVKTLNAANPTFAGKAAGLSTVVNGTNVVYHASTEPNSYDYAVYSDGSNTLLQGQSVRIDSDNYQFHGSTESGKNIFTDNSGDLYYIENNTLNAVTLPNGSTANAGTLGDTFQVNLGGETINQDSTLYTGYAQSKTDYVDTLSSNIDV